MTRISFAMTAAELKQKLGSELMAGGDASLQLAVENRMLSDEDVLGEVLSSSSNAITAVVCRRPPPPPTLAAIYEELNKARPYLSDSDYEHMMECAGESFDLARKSCSAAASALGYLEKHYQASDYHDKEMIKTVKKTMRDIIVLRVQGLLGKLTFEGEMTTVFDQLAAEAGTHVNTVSQLVNGSKRMDEERRNRPVPNYVMRQRLRQQAQDDAAARAAQ